MEITRLKLFEYALIALGAMLAFVAAFETQLALGYYLHAGVLLAGLLPYFVYSIAVVLWNSPAVTLHGVLLLLVHAWVVAGVRFVGMDGYSGALLVYAPLVLSLALIPAAVMAWRQPWGAQASD